jgi:predicted MFS family arabinose efflux permease
VYPEAVCLIDPLRERLPYIRDKKMTTKQKKATAWIVVIVAFLGGLALANVQNKVPPCVLVVMDYFQIDMTTAGWLTSVFAIMGMISAVPAAYVLNRLGPKRCGVISLACAIIGSLIGVFTSNLALLLFSRVIEGVGVGIIAVVGPSLISMWFPAEKRGLPMGLWGSWMMVSQSLLFFVGGSLTVAFGWQGMWWFTLGICVVVAILYQWKVDSPPPELNHADQETENFDFKGAFKSSSTWFLAGAGMIFTLCCFGFATWIATYWSETFNWDIDAANKWVSIMYALEIPIVIGIGWCLDRTKHRKIIGILGFVLYSGILFYCFRMDNPALIIPFIIVYPLLEGIIPTVYWTVCPSTAKKPEHVGVSLGILNVGLNLGTLIGPPMTGFLIENYGWTTATIPLAIAALIGAVLMWRVKLYQHEKVEN